MAAPDPTQVLPGGFLPPTPGGGVPGEPAAFALPAASWGARAGSVLLDGLVLVVIGAVAAGLVYALTGDGTWTDTYVEDGETVRDEYSYAAVAGFGVFIVASLVFPWLVLGLWKGRTPGRALVGVRVVSLDGTPVGVGRAFVREGVVKGLLSLFTLPLLLSYLWPLWEKHQRALHDLLASTRVVRDAPRPAVATASPLTPAPGEPGDLAGQIGLGG